jgi:hypothetical protein
MLLLYALDLAHYYSQVANYMRLNGMLPPSALSRPGHGRNLISDSFEVNARIPYQRTRVSRYLS